MCILKHHTELSMAGFHKHVKTAEVPLHSPGLPEHSQLLKTRNHFNYDEILGFNNRAQISVQGMLVSKHGVWKENEAACQDQTKYYLSILGFEESCSESVDYITQSPDCKNGLQDTDLKNTEESDLETPYDYRSELLVDTDWKTQNVWQDEESKDSQTGELRDWLESDSRVSTINPDDWHDAEEGTYGRIVNDRLLPGQNQVTKVLSSAGGAEGEPGRGGAGRGAGGGAGRCADRIGGVSGRGAGGTRSGAGQGADRNGGNAARGASGTGGVAGRGAGGVAGRGAGGVAGRGAGGVAGRGAGGVVGRGAGGGAGGRDAGGVVGRGASGTGGVAGRGAGGVVGRGASGTGGVAGRGASGTGGVAGRCAGGVAGCGASGTKSGAGRGAGVNKGRGAGGSAKICKPVRGGKVLGNAAELNRKEE